MTNTISIQPIQLTCPLCKEEHNYQLKLTEAPIIYQPTALNFDWQTNYGMYQREFVCPTTSDKFPAEFKITVMGIVKELEIIN